MNRFSCLALTAGVTVLGAASVATADLVTQPVSFTLDFSGFYPGTVGYWLIEHDLEVTYNDVTGDIDELYENVDATFVVGGEQIVVTTEIELLYPAGTSELEMSYVIPDAPFGYGPMEIELNGYVDFGTNDGWSGQLQASVSSGSGFFGDGENYDVDFSAVIIPAPGAIALFGLAGLSGRRRRD